MENLAPIVKILFNQFFNQYSFKYFWTFWGFSVFGGFRVGGAEFWKVFFIGWEF